MKLSDAQRARYARHLLLPELGEEGQLRLLTGSVRPSKDSDAGALQVARDYLARAGLQLNEQQGAARLLVAAEQSIDQLAGAPELVEAARALAGAFAAVEVIKTMVGIGSSSELSRSFSLASEDA